jgi:hypothetical protein
MSMGVVMAILSCQTPIAVAAECVGGGRPWRAKGTSFLPIRTLMHSTGCGVLPVPGDP